MKKKKVEKTVESNIQVNLQWKSAEELPTVYSNQVLISHTGPEFYLIFGEVVTPAIKGKIKDEIPDTLDVLPQVKIAISNQMMIQIAKIINENVDNYIVKNGGERELIRDEG